MIAYFLALMVLALPYLDTAQASGKLDLVSNFHAAVRNNQTYEAHFYLKAGVDVNDRGGYRNTPLHTAISNNSQGMVNLLLAAPQLRINTPDADGWSPLHSAVFLRRVHFVSQLLGAPGIDVNAQILLTESNEENLGRTPLHLAVIEGFTESIELLCQEGALINAADDQGKTPLHIAAFYGRLEVLKILLSQPTIELNLRNAQGKTPLQVAQLKGHLPIIQALLKAGALPTLPSVHVPKNCTNDEDPHLLQSTYFLQRCASVSFGPLLASCTEVSEEHSSGTNRSSSMSSH